MEGRPGRHSAHRSPDGGSHLRETTLEEWQAEAIYRFGPDPDRWFFVCPACKRVQCRADFLALGMYVKQADIITAHACIRRWYDRDCMQVGGPVSLIISPGEVRPTFEFA